MARKKKEENIEEVKKPKAIGPFDIIKMIFTDRNSFNNLSNTLLAKNFFMINRIFSIQFPLQAQVFNKLSISQSDVIKCWANFAVSKLGYGRVPGFVFTKSGKKNIEQIEEGIDKETKDAYCLFNKISYKDLNDMLYFCHDLIMQDLTTFYNDTHAESHIEKIKKKIKFN